MDALRSFYAYITAYAEIFLCIASLGFTFLARKTGSRSDALFLLFLATFCIVIVLFFE